MSSSVRRCRPRARSRSERNCGTSKFVETCATWSRRRPGPPAEEAESPAPRQRGRVLDEHPTSDAEIVRKRRNDITGLALERDMAGAQAGYDLFERADGNCVGCHERQIGNREPREKPRERR